MTLPLGRVGRINRQRFLESEDTLISVLKARLKGEPDKSTRSDIRQMIRRVV